MFADFDSLEYPVDVRGLGEFPGRGTSHVYAIFCVVEGREIPIYIGRTTRLSERMGDYWSKNFAAPTDFRVGEAIVYLRDEKKLRILVRYKQCSQPARDEYVAIRNLQTSGTRLLNDLTSYRYKDADPTEERGAVRSFCDILIHPSSSFSTRESSAGASGG
jgi:hypothetical protein